MITEMFKIRQLKGATARLKGSTQTQLLLYQRSSLCYNVQFNVQHNLAKHVKE